MKNATIALIALIASTLPAIAGDRPTLRADVAVNSEIVHLSDLITGLPDNADAAVFRAPDIGTTGHVPASVILSAARNHGVKEIETLGLTDIAVTRAGRPIDLDAIEATLTGAIERQHTLDKDSDLSIAFDATVRPTFVEATAAAQLVVQRLNWNAVTGRFDALLTVPDSALSARSPIRVTGVATELVPVPAYGQAMGRGDIVRSDDVVLQRMPRGQVPHDAVTDLAAALGQALRRPVRAGTPILSVDLTKPDIVQRNAAVTLVYEQPGMILTVRATAVEGGAEGETISVINPQSKRVIEAVVTGPGRVTVTPGATSAAIN